MRRVLLTLGLVAGVVAGLGPVGAQTPNPNETPLPPPQATATCSPSKAAGAAAGDFAGMLAATARCADLTARRPMKVGGVATTWGANLGGFVTAPGPRVTLTDANRIPGASARCAFDISYTIENVGHANAGPPATFRDVLRVDGRTVGIQSGLTLAAGATRLIHTQAHLPAGVHQLTLDLNDPPTIPGGIPPKFFMKYRLSGRCAGR